jgi:hypothetical protein
MKTALLLASAALLPSCLTIPSTIPLQDPVVRTVERVIARHDIYVMTDMTLPQATIDAYLAESGAVSALLDLDEVSARLLEASIEGVLERHDAYVTLDVTLDDLAREVYLADSVRIQGLLDAVPALVE